MFRQKKYNFLTSLNYKVLKILPVRISHKLFSILNVSNQTVIKRENKQSLQAYGMSLRSTNKQCRHSFVNKLGLVKCANSLHLNIKKSI